LQTRKQELIEDKGRTNRKAIGIGKDKKTGNLEKDQEK
jgi:hypothetical protein